METVSKRDLNQHTASVLARVTEEGDIIITERGEPRWRVSAFEQQDSVLARMEREGHYTPPSSAPAPWPSTPGGRKYTEAEVTALLDEVRGDH